MNLFFTALLGWVLVKSLVVFALRQQLGFRPRPRVTVSQGHRVTVTASQGHRRTSTFPQRTKVPPVPSWSSTFFIPVLLVVPGPLALVKNTVASPSLRGRRVTAAWGSVQSSPVHGLVLDQDLDSRFSQHFQNRLCPEGVPLLTHSSRRTGSDQSGPLC